MIILAYTNKRVGISYISDKSDLPGLYNEEILVDKSTGNVYVKTPTKGNVISFNYLTRINAHINRLISNTYSHAMLKSLIMKITPDGMTFPATSGMFNTNLIGDTPISLDRDEGCFRVMLSIDIDCVDIVSGEISNNTKFDMHITYELMSTQYDDPVRVYSGELTLDEFNNTVFEFPEPNDDIVLTKLIIGESSQTSVRYILNSIYGLFNTNGMYPLSNLNVAQQHTEMQIKNMPFKNNGIRITAENMLGEIVNIGDYTYEIFYIDGDNLIPDGVGDGVFQYMGQHRIVFTFGKLTTSYDFDVVEEALVELFMIREPDTVSYEIGDSFDTTGMVLQGVYNTGTVAEITDYNISGFDSTTAGSCCVTIGCDNCAVECTVDVLPCLWNYVVVDSEVTILSYLGRNRVVNVPASLEDLPVVYIERYVFYENQYIRVVNIPDTVKYIG